MEKRYGSAAERQRAYRERLQCKAGKVAIGMETPIWVAYDSERYPVRKAWEIAVERVQRARGYAAKFPQFIRESDLKYQDVGWQYENEGLKAVKKKETVLVP